MISTTVEVTLGYIIGLAIITSILTSLGIAVVLFLLFRGEKTIYKPPSENSPPAREQARSPTKWGIRELGSPFKHVKTF